MVLNLTKLNIKSALSEIRKLKFKDKKILKQIFFISRKINVTASALRYLHVVFTRSM